MTTNREANYQIARDKAAEALRQLAPELAAHRSAIVYHRTEQGQGEFVLPFWGDEYRVGHPDIRVRQAGKVEEPTITTQILLLHYLVTADGAPMADRWLSFRELPDGLVYDSAFQGRASERIAATYGRDKAGFMQAATMLGGERLTYGDASFMFRVFPRLNLAVVLHLADEEFEANANVLFDAAATHYLPIEDLSVVGGLVASRLVKAGRFSASM
jgi:hypothetical protein